ncbi:MAG: M48 family metalloprotease [Acidobacteriota bacterium]|nr:M48 family metalloprotease [Acidobacteriota bacterium]
MLVLAAMLAAAPAHAQIGAVQRGAQKGADIRKAVGDLVFSDEEKREIGLKISAQLRERYGVVQDARVTKYVSLVGMTVARASKSPSLAWQFIVLDTDAVNAYAAPGGVVHITRGALGVLQSEAELAGVLGHEIGHITADHTIAAIRKGKLVELGANATRSQVLDLVANKGYSLVFENAFDRGDEIDADKTSVESAGKAGYAPAALSSFLAALAERNKNVKEPNGLFASHPLIKERTDRIAKFAKDAKLTSAATVQARYRTNISYKPIPMSAITTVAAPAAAAEAKPAAKKPGLGASLRDRISSGSANQSTQVAASAGARGVGPDRDAKGGPNKAVVRVTVTDAELASFKGGIA